MLSYQHMYHAGNLADVHKHMLLAWSLDYMTRKDKPLVYIETHAGRGLYDLTHAAARKTGEADAGVNSLLATIDPGHPFAQTLQDLRAEAGETLYPGSPMIAARLLRPFDKLHLAELHPSEHAALQSVMAPYPATCHATDGFELAHALCPPTPRRGLMLIDPSYEMKADYAALPKNVRKINRAWNVGVICLWYPILTTGLHKPMLAQLQEAHPDALRHELRFPPAKSGHGMIGSGMFVINPPFGIAEETDRIEQLFSQVSQVGERALIR